MSEVRVQSLGKGLSKQDPKPMKDQQKDHAGKTVPFGPAGLLLLNSAFDPLYANEEAVSILGYPDSQIDARCVEKVLAKLIQSSGLKIPGTLRTAGITRIKSGRRHYSCRLFPVSPLSDDRQRSVMALLIERNAVPSGLLTMVEEFKLTEREYQAVQHLALGLTSKEISVRMGISPNTVKAFLRLVMIKTGVTTRSGIIGKLLKSA